MLQIPEQTFIEKFGALIIAVIALIQPWLIALWKKYCRPGRIDFFKTGKLEIGFNGFASTIGINGTLKGTNKDLYISNIHLNLSKKKDSSQHRFEWSIFRDTKLKLSGNKEMEVELPYGIMLSTNSPQRINIQFHDLNQQEIISVPYDELSSHWSKFLEKHFPINERTNSQEDNARIFSIYQDFSKTKEQTGAYARFNRELYWEESDYELEMVIETSNPIKEFKSHFKFHLTEADCENLRLNVLNLIDYGCNQLRFDWIFVYTNYK
ncbi:MAG: hypothetical protein RBS81_00125 [Tenuifilaceae bacterium]|jgi:hypothetical protein|nr:hypothetical protein [Tenuifilaceae bacterium]